MAPDIARAPGRRWGVLAIWIVGGLLSLCGALSYAELATAYPGAGGDYVYLSKAYGRWAGFLFGWAQLTVVRPGDIAVMAFAFATYVRAIYDPLAGYPGAQPAGLRRRGRARADDHQHPRRHPGQVDAEPADDRQGAGPAGHCGCRPGRARRPGHVTEVDGLPMSLALIFVLFTYGGWNEMAYVAAEVKDPRRNIVRALVTGTVAVIVLYLLVNGAFLYTLGYDGLATSKAVASDADRDGLSDRGVAADQRPGLHLGPRGRQRPDLHRRPDLLRHGRGPPDLQALGRWDPRTGTPVWALAVQGLIALGLILAFGGYIDAILYTAAAVYAFYLGTSLSRDRAAVQRAGRGAALPGDRLPRHAADLQRSLRVPDLQLAQLRPGLQAQEPGGPGRHAGGGNRRSTCSRTLRKTRPATNPAEVPTPNQEFFLKSAIGGRATVVYTVN